MAGDRGQEAGVRGEKPDGRRAETLYALAVAACRLNRVEDARRWLEEALELGGKAMKLRAMDDRALEVLWIGE